MTRELKEAQANFLYLYLGGTHIYGTLVLVRVLSQVCSWSPRLYLECKQSQVSGLPWREEFGDFARPGWLGGPGVLDYQRVVGEQGAKGVRHGRLAVQVGKLEFGVAAPVAMLHTTQEGKKK